MGRGLCKVVDLYQNVHDIVHLRDRYVEYGADGCEDDNEELL